MQNCCFVILNFFVSFKNRGPNDLKHHYDIITQLVDIVFAPSCLWLRVVALGLSVEVDIVVVPMLNRNL